MQLHGFTLVAGVAEAFTYTSVYLRRCVHERTGLVDYSFAYLARSADGDVDKVKNKLSEWCSAPGAYFEQWKQREKVE